TAFPAPWIRPLPTRPGAFSTGARPVPSNTRAPVSAIVPPGACADGAAARNPPTIAAAPRRTAATGAGIRVITAPPDQKHATKHEIRKAVFSVSRCNTELAEPG